MADKYLESFIVEEKAASLTSDENCLTPSVYCPLLTVSLTEKQLCPKNFPTNDVISSVRVVLHIHSTLSG